MEQPTKIIAIISTQDETIKAGGAPVFVTRDRETLQKVSTTLSRTLDASVHEVDANTMILVAH